MTLKRIHHSWHLYNYTYLHFIRLEAVLIRRQRHKLLVRLNWMFEMERNCKFSIVNSIREMSKIRKRNFRKFFRFDIIFFFVFLLLCRLFILAFLSFTSCCLSIFPFQYVGVCMYVWLKLGKEKETDIGVYTKCPIPSGFDPHRSSKQCHAAVYRCTQKCSNPILLHCFQPHILCI